MRSPLQPMGVGPVTRWLCIGLIGCSLLFKVTERNLGFGTADLIFVIDAVLAGQVWRIATYPLVHTSAFGLIVSAIVLFLFGRFFETQWGSRDYLRFFVVSAVGAALLAIPISFAVRWLLNFNDVAMAAGPGPIFDAMLMAMALTLPNSNVLLGFVLPVRARNLVYVLLGIEVISAVMNGAATLSVTLGGLAMGYLLVTGNWRIGRVVARQMAKRGPRRHGLYVVPPGDAGSRTIH
jgi:membrane associated rhomboid family serine protease